MTFHVGQRVICVDDLLRVSFRKEGFFGRWSSWETLDHNLNRGDIYRVSAVYQMADIDSGKPVVCLGVVEAKHFKFPEIGFPAMQFRPLLEKKTDISCFTEILDRENGRTRERVDVRA